MSIFRNRYMGLTLTIFFNICLFFVTFAGMPSTNAVVLKPATEPPVISSIMRLDTPIKAPPLPRYSSSIKGPVSPLPPKLDEICDGFDVDASRVYQLFDYDDGTAIGSFSTLVQANDIEVVQFVPEHAFHLKYIHFYFMGTPGLVELHVYRDYARSWPDESNEFITPITVMVSTTNAWTTVDISSMGVYIHPSEHFWVGYKHKSKHPLLGVDAENNSNNRSRLKSQKLIDDWRRDGLAFVWAAIAYDYLIRAEGDYICEHAVREFTDVSIEAGFGPINYVRTAFVDVNNDNHDDVYLTGSRPDADLNHEGLFINQKDGTFLDVSATCGLQGNALAFGTFGDIDNDGDLDMYGAVWTQPTGVDKGTRDMIFYNDGTGNFTKNTTAGVEEDHPSAAASFADYDNDGFIDLYVGTWLIEYPNPPAFPDHLFHNNGDGTFTDVTSSVGMADQGPQNRPCYGVSWSDFDNDGDMDCFAGNYGYAGNFLWQNNGGTFTDVAEMRRMARDDVGTNGGNTFGGDWGDYDNDGDMDYYRGEIAHPRYQPWSDPPALLANSGALFYKFFDVREISGIAYDEGEIEATWVDYDNDGDLDLFTSCLYSNHWARFYRQEADHTFTDVTYLTGINIHDAVAHAWADYDRDGDLDCLASSRDGNIVYLYRNDVGNKNDWIHIKLVGIDCNKAAIGARVMVKAGPLNMMREVQGGKGHNSCQGSLPVEFGLGKFNPLNEVKIRWPCGKIQIFTTIMKNSFVIIEEDNPTVMYDGTTPVNTVFPMTKWLLIIICAVVVPIFFKLAR